MTILRSPHQSTLQLSMPFGRTFLSATVIVMIIMISAEALARTDYAREHLAAPDVTNHPQLGVKFSLYEKRLSEGPIDCIFVGSSMVNNGVDPEAVSMAYYEATGDTLRCFNFGIDSLDLVGAANLSELLIKRYDPRIIIFPVTFRDFVNDNSYQLNNQWALYEIGQFSLPGWLGRYSRAYQYYETYKFQWVNTAYLAQQTFTKRVSPYGYFGMRRASDVSAPPGVAARFRYFRLELYEVAALDRLLALQQEGTRIVLIELPLPDTGMGLLPGGEADYDSFASMVITHSESHGIPYLQTRDSLDIPTDGWFNYLHLNRTGAEVFSQWIGRQLGQLLAESSE